MEPMAAFIVTGSPTETHLQSIEAMPLPMRDRWAEYDSQIRLTDALISQRVKERMSPLDYLRHPIQALQAFRVARAINSLLPDEASLLDSAGYLYRRSIAASRGVRILVALRRRKNATSRWPLRLNELRASLPEEILTDPLNGGPFAYQPTADAFSLYSKGRNSIDENGQYDSNGPDDWPIWPPRERGPKTEQGKP